MAFICNAFSSLYASRIGATLGVSLVISGLLKSYFSDMSKIRNVWFVLYPPIKSLKDNLLADSAVWLLVLNLEGFDVTKHDCHPKNIFRYVFAAESEALFLKDWSKTQLVINEAFRVDRAVCIPTLPLSFQSPCRHSFTPKFFLFLQQQIECCHVGALETV